MAHAAARRGGAAGDEAGGGFPAAALFLIGKKPGGVFFGGAADFADHDDRMRFGVGEEHFQHVDMLGALDRVAADAHGRGLPKAHIRGLFHRLIGQRARARDHADRPAAKDRAGHDADLAGAGRHHAGAIRPDQAAFGPRQRALDLHHVQNRDAFGDAHDQRHFGVDRFKDAVGRKGRGNIDHAGVGLCRVPGLVDRVEDRQVQMRGAALAGGHAADHPGAVGDGLFRVERALAAGKALADQLGVFVDEYGHVLGS